MLFLHFITFSKRLSEGFSQGRRPRQVSMYTLFFKEEKVGMQCINIYT